MKFEKNRISLHPSDHVSRGQSLQSLFTFAASANLTQATEDREIFDRKHLYLPNRDKNIFANIK